MKIKMSVAEFLALHDLLQRCIMCIKPKGIQAHVLHGVLFRLFKKFYTKALTAQLRYTITMEADEACAFHMFFTRHSLNNEEVFTINLVHTINNRIHQTYSA
jgi:hypothetical protein